MKYVNIITQAGKLDAIPDIIAGGIDIHHPTLAQAHAAGWRRLPVNAVVPANHTVVSRSYAQHEGDPDAAVESIVTRPTAEIVDEQAAADALSTMDTRMLRALVKVINLRLPADRNITAEELIATYKALP